LSSLVIDGGVPGNDYWKTSYEAQAGVLVQHTLVTNGVGDVIGSQYDYAGGAFEMLFTLEQNGSTIVGSFAAPILSLTVTAGEAAGEGAKASYVLGASLFDQVIAAALGIGRHTSGGWASSRLLLRQRKSARHCRRSHDARTAGVGRRERHRDRRAGARYARASDDWRNRPDASPALWQDSQGKPYPDHRFV
jgi:hypothetical protein